MEFCKVACVLAGGGIGSVARFFIASEIQRLFPAYPWGTLCVNLAGSFIIGILWAFCYSFDFSPNLRVFFIRRIIRWIYHVLLILFGNDESIEFRESPQCPILYHRY